MPTPLDQDTTAAVVKPTAPPFESWFPDSPFDATYGCGMDELLDVRTTTEPDDFAEFWTSLYVEANAVDTRPQHKWAASHDGLDIFDVAFSTLGGHRLGGWLVLPQDGIMDRGIVVSHGYGGRAAPDLDLPLSRTAMFFPCGRGLPARGLVPGIPNDIDQHVLHGIQDKSTYVHAGNAADVWCAATTLQLLCEDRLSRLDYFGVSFGGGIGALAVPWDSRFSSAVLMVPSFGQHELRRELPCNGSGESLRLYAAEHPEVRQVLPYFDAALAARHISIPTLVGAALWDPVVPPPCQFAVYNELRERRRELFVFSAGHVSYPEEDTELQSWQAVVARFLRT